MPYRQTSVLSPDGLTIWSYWLRAKAVPRPLQREPGEPVQFLALPLPRPLLRPLLNRWTKRLKRNLKPKKQDAVLMTQRQDFKHYKGKQH